MNSDLDHRIISQSVSNGDYVVWTGEDYPSESAVAISAAKIRERHLVLGHDGLNQMTDDALSIQRKRRFGWATLDVINVYDNREDDHA